MLDLTATYAKSPLRIDRVVAASASAPKRIAVQTTNAVTAALLGGSEGIWSNDSAPLTPQFDRFFAASSSFGSSLQARRRSFAAAALPFPSTLLVRLHTPHLVAALAKWWSNTISFTGLALAVGVLVLLASTTRNSTRRRRLLDGENRQLLQPPPIVRIPREVQLSIDGHAAYANALDTFGNGDVVCIPRHGRMEYVIDARHARNVLSDVDNFSFERAVTTMLHMQFMLYFKQGTFVQQLDSLVHDGVTPRLRAVVETIGPVFAKESQPDTIDDVYGWAHRTIADAMVTLVIGKHYASPRMTEHFMAIVSAVSCLAGIYENTRTSYRYGVPPWLWSLTTTLRAVFGTIVPRFFFGVVPTLWRNRKRHLHHGMDVEHNDYAPFLDLLVARHCNATATSITPWNFLWCATIALGVIFASVHQTAVVAVWCVTALAQRSDEYLPALREEWSQHIPIDADGNTVMSYGSLKQLTLLDSFIREVMRTKGDTFAPVRYTTADVRVGRYVIPKNSLCAPYVRRAHQLNYDAGDVARATTFDGFQWHHKQRPATQLGADFISFGMGRWACPGRHLAIAEIKMLILSLFREHDVRIRPNSFYVSDPMNTTSVAPHATLSVTRLTAL